LGDVPELAAQRIRGTGSHFPKLGPVVTAGGLIFAGTRDGKARALDVANGQELWAHQLDAGLEGMPAVYAIAGREFVVFCASAPTTMNKAEQTKIRGAYVAFALPKTRAGISHRSSRFRVVAAR